MPICSDMFVVAAILPGGDLLDEVELVGDAAIETLTRQHAELGFGHIEPTAVFRGVVPFEPLDETTGFGCGEGFVERLWFVGVEVAMSTILLAAGK